jgi:drug/metabolite transporter (DMT)-like permease
VSSAAALSVLYNGTITGGLCYWAYFRVVADLPVVMSTVGTLMVPVIGVFATAWACDTRLRTTTDEQAQ